MLKLQPLEFIVRGIPETFLFILAVYAFSKNTVDTKKYLLSSILLAVVGYITRLLPVHYGVPTILNLFALIVIAVNINKLDLMKSIQTSIIVYILQFICEGLNVLIIQYIFKANLPVVFNDPTLKTLYGIPSTLIFAFLVIVYYLRVCKRKELKRV